MASGRSRTVTGAFIGTGASLSINKVGFKPRAVLLFNQDDAAFGLHVEGMADGSVGKQKASVTNFATADGVTLGDTGFTVGADTDLNVDGERTWYVCWE